MKYVRSMLDQDCKMKTFWGLCFRLLVAKQEKVNIIDLATLLSVNDYNEWKIITVEGNVLLKYEIFKSRTESRFPTANLLSGAQKSVEK